MLPRPSDLPIEYIVDKSKLLDGFVLVKTRLELSTGETDLVIEGASYGSDENLCILKAKSEVMEKFYAHHAIAFKHSYRGWSIKYRNKYKYFNNRQVVLGLSLDATGLSFGPENLAINHGLEEVVERHLLATVWYGNNKIFVTQKSTVDCFEVISYKIKSLDLPFAVVIIKDENHGVIFCGSAIRENYKYSVDHARNEAFMLYESYIDFLKSAVIPQVNTKSGKRIFNLNRETFNKQNEHLNYRCCESEDFSPEDNYTLDSIISHAGLNLDDFRYFKLFQDKNHSSIRVICTSALTPKLFRNENFINDPFY